MIALSGYWTIVRNVELNQNFSFDYYVYNFPIFVKIICYFKVMKN